MRKSEYLMCSSPPLCETVDWYMYRLQFALSHLCSMKLISIASWYLLFSEFEFIILRVTVSISGSIRPFQRLMSFSGTFFPCLLWNNFFSTLTFIQFNDILWINKFVLCQFTAVAFVENSHKKKFYYSVECAGHTKTTN